MRKRWNREKKEIGEVIKKKKEEDSLQYCIIDNTRNNE